jgi:VIT1/CCC1 family predicted Fe2+/Mn2+ transporter
VILLVTPYLLQFDIYEALGTALAVATGVILVFSYHVSVARDQPFGRRFTEMLVVTFGVAVFSFIVGLAFGTAFHIEI